MLLMVANRLKAFFWKTPVKNAATGFLKEMPTILYEQHQLSLELTVEQGVSRYDDDNPTDMVLYCITCPDRLKKKEYGYRKRGARRPVTAVLCVFSDGIKAERNSSDYRKRNTKAAFA